MSKTLIADLLAPYAECLQRLGEARMMTVAEALIRAEAAHIAKVRNDQGEPFGGWKNKLPLEHATALGFFIRACRTDDKTYIREQSNTCEDRDIREIYDTLCNAENVYFDFNMRGMTTDEIINYAAQELRFYGESA